MRRTVDLLEGFAEETGQSVHEPDIRRQGYLWLTTDSSRVAAQRGLVERQQGWGVDGVELLTGDETRGRLPWVSEGRGVGPLPPAGRAGRSPADHDANPQAGRTCAAPRRHSCLRVRGLSVPVEHQI